MIIYQVYDTEIWRWQYHVTFFGTRQIFELLFINLRVCAWPLIVEFKNSSGASIRLIISEQQFQIDWC